MKSIFVRVGIYFLLALSVMTVMIATIFTRFSRQNVRKMYRAELKTLAKSVSDRVSEAVANDEGATPEFNSFLNSIINLGDMRDMDIWILSNSQAQEPLPQVYTNISNVSDLPDDDLDEDLKIIIHAAEGGKTRSYTGYDKVYEQNMMHLAMPIKSAKGMVMGTVVINGAIDNWNSTVSTYQRYLLISLIMALFVTILVAAFLSRQIARPIVQIKSVAGKMAAGDYEQQTYIKRKDELGQLADTIDILSERLGEADELRESVEQNRRDFFSNVSHELRTPITVIKGYAEILNDGYVEDVKKQKKYYERILRECGGMERLVSDLLIMSRMQNPEYEMEEEVFNLIALAQDALRGLRVLTKEERVEFSLIYNDENALVLGDYERIRQVFVILLQNALKYADPETIVRVRINVEEEDLLVEIEDEGIGIPREEWETIFEKFYRAKNHGEKEGSGIGLVVAKTIMERHHGKIWVESDEVKIVTFHLTFPRVKEREERNGQD